MRGRNAPPVEDGLENRDPSAPPPPSQRCVFQMGENGAGEGGKGGGEKGKGVFHFQNLIVSIATCRI